MRIITWNCKMKFRRDCERLFSLKPDILIIPECEDVTKYSIFNGEYSDAYWIGENTNKGLAVFTKNNFKIKIYENYSDKFKYILPLVITRQNELYNLLAIWTKKVEGKRKGHSNYIRQINLSMDAYGSFLNDYNSIICGDFNSNLIWERTGVDKDHQWLIDYLAKKDIYSAYHHYFSEDQGKESTPTYYHYHREDRPFHIDFCFLSKKLLNQISSISIGKYKEWIDLSDHVPMQVEF